MDQVIIHRATGIRGDFRAPPSKSYTHRAFIAAALADGRSLVRGPLDAADTRVTRSALERMGVRIHPEEEGYRIDGSSGQLTCPEPPVLDMGESGTSFRLMMSVALLCPCPVTLTGGARMRERPVGDLVISLESLGASVRYLENTGCPPVTVSGLPHGGDVVVRGGTSSQFISSLLMTAPCWEKGAVISVEGDLVSSSYLDITLDIMSGFGIRVSRNGYREFSVFPGQHYKAGTCHVEGDYSSASYFFAAAAVAGGTITAFNLNPSSVQGDRVFLERLGEMGCTVCVRDDRIILESDGVLDGIETDMSTAPDTVPTLCAVAACARTPTRITGVGHLRFKESDRIGTMGKIIRSCGAGYRSDADSITITPAPLRGTTVDPENDHRVAMSAAVLGLRTGGMVIQNPACVEKSYPAFFTDLAQVVV